MTSKPSNGLHRPLSWKRTDFLLLWWKLTMMAESSSLQTHFISSSSTPSSNLIGMHGEFIHFAQIPAFLQFSAEDCNISSFSKNSIFTFKRKFCSHFAEYYGIILNITFCRPKRTLQGWGRAANEGMHFLYRHFHKRCFVMFSLVDFLLATLWLEKEIAKNSTKTLILTHWWYYCSSKQTILSVSDNNLMVKDCRGCVLVFLRMIQQKFLSSLRHKKALSHLGGQYRSSNKISNKKDILIKETSRWKNFFPIQVLVANSR